MTDFTVHPILSYSQHAVVPGHYCHIIWDLRESPDVARLALDLETSPSPLDLSEFATTPPVPLLHVVCDIFPGHWPIRSSRLEGVTVGDVLRSIHSVLMKRISHEEWDRLSSKQQERIQAIFENRCNRAVNRDECRSHGVIRVDCLIQHTWFAGLSASFEMDSTCILTLRRPSL
ncbi:hypothetical protein GALMADRAFT_223086 [Galerina marginata CBS 339.88]|uniref:DUF6699 domain-containing protein n=1 Tax=Galerina marginata (strain CBS 339.88) TaxID=685588 RepID=A0A067TCW1_GALM3|nr:hypothetical protein GALMADRAFT_223086 [Galerina marginata CBS 339.88]